MLSWLPWDGESNQHLPLQQGQSIPSHGMDGAAGPPRSAPAVRQNPRPWEMDLASFDALLSAPCSEGDPGSIHGSPPARRVGGREEREVGRCPAGPIC